MWKFVLFVTAFVYSINAQSLGQCDPLVPEECVLPFPNDFWLRDGLLRLENNTLPKPILGKPVNPYVLGVNSMDGFSNYPCITSLWKDVSLLNVPSHSNISASLDENSPTILLETTTMKIIAHWAELDESDQKAAERAFMMWPANKLKAGTRYIVAQRFLVSQSTGLPLYPSQAFLELRDNLSSSDPNVYLRREHFEKDIFPQLEQIGVDRNTLQLAWDFTTSSTSSVTGRLLHIRKDGLQRIPSVGPTYYITNVTNNPSPNITRIIHGNMLIPLYLTSPNPGSYFVIGKDGLPEFQKFANASFTISIPASVVNSNGVGIPSPIQQVGHGLFADQSVIENPTFQQMAYNFKNVQACIDWWGLAKADLGPVLDMVSLNLSNFKIIPDRNQQAVLNHMVLTKLLTQSIVNDPSVTFGGVSVLNPKNIHYFGISLGGILGTVLMSVSQDLPSGVLNVPGTPFGLLCPRSIGFQPLYSVLKLKYPKSLNHICLFNVFQILWDRAEPAGYADHVVSNPLPDTPTKVIALQYALSDGMVSWLGGLNLGRSMQAVMFPNNPPEDKETIYGYNVVKGPVTTGATIQGYNYGTPPVPQTNIPPPELYNTHMCVYGDPRSQSQDIQFYTNGDIYDPCNGEGCNPNVPSADGKSEGFDCAKAYPVDFT